MEMSGSTSNIFKAFSRAQVQFRTLYKNKESYSANYTEIHSFVEMISPVLFSNGLAFMQDIRTDESTSDIGCSTLLTHSSGEWIKSAEMLMPKIISKKMNPAQSIASSTTYVKRYSLAAFLGLVSSNEDTDAHERGHFVKGLASKQTLAVLEQLLINSRWDNKMAQEYYYRFYGESWTTENATEERVRYIIDTVYSNEDPILDNGTANIQVTHQEPRQLETADQLME